MKKNNLFPFPKVILFDWDNTLVDSFGLIASVMNHTLVQFGKKPWTQEESRLYIQRSGREAMQTYFGDQHKEASDFFYRSYEEQNYALALLPDAYDLLATLSQQGVKMGIVSNKHPNLMHPELKALKVFSFFDVCIGAGEAEQDKPAPDPVLLALKQMNQKPEKESVWFVGDMPVDWICAEASGCFSVAMGDFEADSYSNIGLRVANCAELKKMLWIS